ncbi:MAG TPA: hypothetical protein VG347_03570 [Verrucomicrobiae bacterium]|nr:hypothetical protein [Verrucomicrobiae bacterium]
MNLNIKGKIGRLPPALRDEVNVRLQNGETGRALTQWLNGLPVVQALLVAEFGGKAVREQNISEWRRGGHQHWLRVQEAYEMMERMGAGGLPPESEMTGALATWVTAKYLVAAKSAEGMGEDKPASWERMREFCRDVVALRRVDLRAKRLALEQTRMEGGGWMMANQECGGVSEGGAFNAQHSTPNVEATKKAPIVQHPSSREIPSSNIQML